MSGPVRSAPGSGVAILTRSEDRVQLAVPVGLVSGRVLLRSSPGPKTGCSAVHDAIIRGGQRVAILTRSEDRVQRRPDGNPPRPASGCDPHPVRRPGAAQGVQGRLGRSEGVAILTRSEDRVQPGPPRSWADPRHSCDPHPVRRPGAARYLFITSWDEHQLRSSPGPKTGCSVFTRTFRASSRVLRSSPGPKTGCSNRPHFRFHVSDRRCDPHPVRRPGAARSAGPMPDRLRGVAILTRSEDRVQRDRYHGSITPSMLRSSPGPKTGCSTAGRRRTDGRQRRCDPHPVRRPGAARSLAGRRRPRGEVAILTRSEDRVQRAIAVNGTIRAAVLRSSPGPKTGCSPTAVCSKAACSTLRSSPGPKTGCSDDITTSPWQGFKLRSSPGPKTGCSGGRRHPVDRRRLLRSSPGPKTGCSGATPSGVRPSS